MRPITYQTLGTHTPEQADAMRAVLAEVGFADAILVRETAAGYQIIDGNLRAETTPDARRVATRGSGSGVGPTG